MNIHGSGSAGLGSFRDNSLNNAFEKYNLMQREVQLKNILQNQG